MKFVIPFKTPTVNTMYATWNGHRIKSAESRKLSKEVSKLIVQNEILEGELEVKIDVYSNWYNKNKTIKKRDIANLEKFIIDSIFSQLEEMDDKQIFKLTMNKFQSESEFVEVEITKWK